MQENTRPIHKKGKVNRDCYEKFVAWDEFGYPITLNYKGDDTFKTTPGTIITLIINTFLLWTVIEKGMRMALRTDPEFVPYQVT